jgi:hypothetical protein
MGCFTKQATSLFLHVLLTSSCYTPYLSYKNAKRFLRKRLPYRFAVQARSRRRIRIHRSLCFSSSVVVPPPSCASEATLAASKMPHKGLKSESWFCEGFTYPSRAWISKGRRCLKSDMALKPRSGKPCFLRGIEDAANVALDWSKGPAKVA